MTEEQQPVAEADPGRATHRLTRSRRHKMVSGVCGGLGRYFDLDPVIFRVTLGVVSVLGGLGLIAYGFAWLLLPFEDEEENELRRLFSGRVEGGSLSALLCALLGCGLFLASLGNRNDAQVFTLILAGSVVGGTYWSHRRRVAAEGVDAATAQAVADAPPEAQAPPTRESPSWWREPLTKQPAVPGATGYDTGYLWGPADMPDDRFDDGRGPDPYRAGDGVRRRDQGRPGNGYPGRGLGSRTDRRPARRFPMAALVFLLALSAAVTGTTATWATEPLGTSLAVGLSGALAVFGLGLAVSAFVGRLGVGTILSVILTGALLAGATALPENIVTSWSRTDWRPATSSDVQPRYELGTGQGVLDLTRVTLKDDQTVRTSAELGAGELVVRVPNDVTVRLHLSVGIGGYRIPGDGTRADDPGSRSAGGLDLEERVTLHPITGEQPPGTLSLRLELAVGEIRVVQQAPVRDDRRPTPAKPPTPANPPTSPEPAAVRVPGATSDEPATHPAPALRGPAPGEAVQQASAAVAFAGRERQAVVR